jgi:hypothetical protein
VRPWHVRTLLVREPGDWIGRWPLGSDGPWRESEEPQPLMHDPEKSDSGIVAVKPTNKAGRPVAEPVEPRPGTKGNADQQSTHRTQGRVRVTQALSRVRQAARQRGKEPFTALLHHIGGERRDCSEKRHLRDFLCGPSPVRGAAVQLSCFIRLPRSRYS